MNQRPSAVAKPNEKMEYQGESVPNLLLPDTVDRSDTDRIVEESPNRRYAKLNQVLGKGAYKIVYKAIDREEGYEVAWNTCQCDNIFINGAHGEVKIGDMGTAKMKLGKKYTVIGTPEFMAPEMYEEKGYSEKVDIYAFGMALLEMVTGQYPYSECKNAPQIYRKVIQGIKPDCLQQVTDPEVYDLICNCIGHESERLSAQQIVEHPFLAVEPEVVIINNPDKTHLTMQVVFKGMDRLSVKFDFNVDTDTAEEVVNEMISEEVLPAKYQHLITGEINRIIRELSKPASDEKNKEENRQWNSLQRLESAGRDSGSEGHLSLSRKGSMAEMTPFDNMEDFPIKEYPDDYNIEELVRDTAIATKRGMEKAKEWLTKLNAQDVMTVGDLRDLQEEDWHSL
ncbi:hypothetical protein HDV04_000151 [Boothiomyces sp. JEL0838]|nr:hypothetical protein HDV04_000151 [Boothiomyces sp. JEL0838]